MLSILISKSHLFLGASVTITSSSPVKYSTVSISLFIPHCLWMPFCYVTSALDGVLCAVVTFHFDMCKVVVGAS